METTEIAGRKLIVVERYDRSVAADGSVERIHQEDFCQAMGLPPETKYEEDGGPSLQAHRRHLGSGGGSRSLPSELLRAVTLNALIGNGDAHAKNFSLLHHASGALTLAPLYDLLCTLHFGDDRLAMYVDGVHHTNRVTAERLASEAVRWGMSKDHAREIIHAILENAPTAIETARHETDGVPDALVATIESQAAQLRSSE